MLIKRLDQEIEIEIAKKIPPTLTKVGKGQVNNGTKVDKKAGTGKVKFC